MIQNSLDGDRVYVTNSLVSTWDNQFYPGIKGWLTKLDRQSDGSTRSIRTSSSTSTSRPTARARRDPPARRGLHD